MRFTAINVKSGLFNKNPMYKKMRSTAQYNINL